MQPIKGTTNNYPAGQCTRWADDQYHGATGYYVPWSANAKDWATQAVAYGWSVSSEPVVPSILCLQAGVQLASPTFGHVAEVVSINKDGTFTASNLNWGSNPSVPIDVLFHTGQGVSFIYATDNKNKPIGAVSQPSPVQALVNVVTGQGAGGGISLGPNADVTAFLAFLDDNLALLNPLDIPGSKSDTFSFPGGGVSFTDPVAWTEGLLMNLIEDSLAIVWRSLFLLAGGFVIIKALSNFIDFGSLFQTGIGVGQAVGSL